MAGLWITVGVVLVLLLCVSWVSDRRTVRRGGRSRHSSDTAFEAMESRRDAEIMSNPHMQDISWSSWSRRNRPGR